jgi:hypothetical protein
VVTDESLLTCQTHTIQLAAPAKTTKMRRSLAGDSEWEPQEDGGGVNEGARRASAASTELAYSYGGGGGDVSDVAVAVTATEEEAGAAPSYDAAAAAQAQAQAQHPQMSPYVQERAEQLDAAIAEVLLKARRGAAWRDLNFSKLWRGAAASAHTH